MNKSKWIGAAGIAIAAISVPVSYSIAQGPGPGQQPGQTRPFQDRVQMPMPGPGGATMVADGDFLYIMQGNRLFKVDKRELAVRASSVLPLQERGQGPGGPPPEETEE